MRIIKVIVHVADWNATDVEKCTLKAERVARFGVSQEQIQAYEPYLDEEVTVSVKFVDWWDGKQLPSLYICSKRFRESLEKINLFPL